MRGKYLLVLLFFLLISFNLFFIGWAYLTTPLNTSEIVFIKPGWSFKRVVKELEHKKVISQPYLFWGWGVIKGGAYKIKPGEYPITPRLTPLKLLRDLCSGKGIIKHKVIIPEGVDIKQIANILAQKGLINPDKFINLAYNQNFANFLGIEANNIEGYLFPTTYFLPKGLTEKKIIEIMFTEFKYIYQKYAQLAKQKGLSRHKVITLASIVEKETALKAEKPLIASVFLNRLKEGLPLQADPTVIYALPDFNGNLTRKDLTYPSPYNTYFTNGLPPTPICSPGEESIRAVVNAPETSYFYFVSKGNGHYFSTNFNDHIRAVIKYQGKGH
jgi:UPF0755 protein